MVKLIQQLKDVRNTISKKSGQSWTKYNTKKDNIKYQNEVVCFDGAIEHIDKAIRYLERI